ncbi:uncharacterized protein LOC141856199 [Brevipalpus obovatus]|uniref:uncharacterized protein LOC141856199 n=1 Tax=Brevipalpus obovatus TaxID=246614 RepID=UPI003D9F26AD
MYSLDILFTLFFSSSVIILCLANDAHNELSKTKKIQIVYIKVPLATKMRNAASDGSYAESNSNPSGYAIADNNNNQNGGQNGHYNNQPSSSTSYSSGNNGATGGGISQGYNHNSLAADLVNMLKNHQTHGTGFTLGGGTPLPYNTMVLGSSGSGSGNSGSNTYGLASTIDTRPNNQASSNYQGPSGFVASSNAGYSVSGPNMATNNNNNFRPFPTMNRGYSQNGQGNMNTVPNNYNNMDQMNAHPNINGNGNIDKGPAGGYTGPMISVNQNMPSPGSVPVNGNEYRGTESFPANMPKPPMNTDQMKPIGDDGMTGGAGYGSGPSDPLPYGPGETGDPIASGYNPSDFFGPNPTSNTGFEAGLDDGFPFGDMAFDSDPLLNFGGMGYGDDLAKAPSAPKKTRGYGFIMSNALSGLGGLLGDSSSNNNNGNKGLAMAMSNTFPSFVGGPKPASPQASSGNGFGGIRHRLTNFFAGRIPSLNLNNLGGLGSINTGLLGLLGL